MRRIKRTRYRRIGIAAGMLALAALTPQVYLGLSRAATYAASDQAENAQLSGNASRVNSTLAGSGVAVQFGGQRCETSSNATLQDQEAAGSPIYSWTHPTGGKAVIYYDTSALNAEYTSYIGNAMTSWNSSACVDLRATTSCPAGSSCIPLTLGSSSASSSSTLGTTSISYSGSTITRGSIIFYTTPLSSLTSTQRQGTVTHEVGHSLGLKHRATRYKLLYNTNETQRLTVPDVIDFSNVLTLYGARPGVNGSPAPSGAPLPERTEIIID